MDLYEALKAGTEPDELERTFKEELAAAVKKFNNEEDLDEAREELAEEIIYYFSLVLGDEFVKDLSEKDIIEFLKSIEKDLKVSYDTIKKLNLNYKKAGSFNKNKSKSDEDIINDFIKGLR